MEVSNYLHRRIEPLFLPAHQQALDNFMINNLQPANKNKIMKKGRIYPKTAFYILNT